MSDNESIPQDQEPEDEPSAPSAASADSSDGDTVEGDPPIIVQGGGSGTSG